MPQNDRQFILIFQQHILYFAKLSLFNGHHIPQHQLGLLMPANLSTVVLITPFKTPHSLVYDFMDKITELQSETHIKLCERALKISKRKIKK